MPAHPHSCCLPSEERGGLHLHGGGFQGRCHVQKLSGSALKPSLIPHTRTAVFPRGAGSRRTAAPAHTSWVKLGALYELPTTSKVQSRRRSPVSTAHEVPVTATCPFSEPPLLLAGVSRRATATTNLKIPSASLWSPSPSQPPATAPPRGELLRWA